MAWIPILLISALCASPSFCANYRQHCLVETPKSWKDAQSFCRERGFDLATIDDMGAMGALLPSVGDTPGTVWIGLYPGGPPSWYWSLADNDFYKEGERDYRNFQSQGTQPMTFFHKGQWFNTPTTPRYSVCYDANKQGRDRYVLVLEPLTAPAAREYCRKHHTDLVAIRNQTENQIVSEVSSVHFVWIGLFRDNLIWSDMRYSSLRYWSGDEMATDISDTYCGALMGNKARTWCLKPCVEKRPFLCTCNRARVLKVKVRSQDFQDLNDPATKAAILKQLVEDATLSGGHKLTWITRPGGQVFTQEQCQEEDKDMGDA